MSKGAARALALAVLWAGAVFVLGFAAGRAWAPPCAPPATGPASPDTVYVRRPYRAPERVTRPDVVTRYLPADTTYTACLPLPHGLSRDPASADPAPDVRVTRPTPVRVLPGRVELDLWVPRDSLWERQRYSVPRERLDRFVYAAASAGPGSSGGLGTGAGVRLNLAEWEVEANAGVASDGAGVRPDVGATVRLRF